VGEGGGAGRRAGWRVHAVIPVRKTET
jgi:hypothetical protein